MRRMIGLLSIAGIVATGIAAAPGAGAQVQAPATENASAQAGSVRWGSCTDPTLVSFHARCGVVKVPVDYDRPNGDKIDLAVSRVRHTVPDAQFQGVMLVNPGGPGGSGLALSTLGAFVPGGAGGSYDWIGFDPRGVGSSEDALSCIPGYFGYDRPNYVATTPQLEQIWLDRSQSYAAACAGKNNPALLAHLTTVDSARDMDSIRQALGQQQINYYGFSYGTYLGQVYGTMFPERVRRMVLDSNVDPRRVWYPSQLDQDRAFDRNMKIFFAWIAQYRDVYHLGASEQAVENLYYSVLADLDTHPAGGLIGPDEWSDLFLPGGYATDLWPDIAAGFAGWVHDHDWKPLKGLYDSAVGVGDDNLFAVYLGVQCSDAHWPQNYARWRADSQRVYAQAPFFTWGNTWFNAPCLFWPAPSGTPVGVDGSKVQSALLIDEELDAATPFEGSLEVRSRFPNSSLIALPGGTNHAFSLFGNACLDDQIAAYLATGALPPRLSGRRADAFCAPLPPPVPGAGESAAAAAAAASGAPSPALRQWLRDRAGPRRVVVG